MRCNQCELLVINGVLCHETGCPNTDKIYNKEDKEWIPSEVYENEDDIEWEEDAIDEIDF